MKKNIPELRFPGFEGGWEEKRLGEVAVKVGSGSTPRGGEKVYQKQGVLFIRSQNVTGNKLDTKNSTFISSKMNEQMRGSQVLSNDILLNITGASIGRSCVVPDDFDAGNVNQHVCIIRLNKENTPYFTQAFLSSFSGQKKIMRTQVGGGREGINFQGVRSLRIFFPKQNEQKKIAEFLGFVDEWIDNLKAQKEKWEEYKKGIMQKIFSQEIRFKDEGGGDFPEWEEKRLGDVADVVGGGTPDSADETYWNGDIVWFTPTEVKQKYLGDSKRRITLEGIRRSSATILPIGTILLTSRATVGDVAISTVESATNQGFQSLVVHGDQSNEFWYYWLLQNRNELLRRANGSTFPEISGKGVKKLRAQVPSSAEEKKIAEYLSELDHLIDSRKREINQSKGWKQGLMQKMFI